MSRAFRPGPRRPRAVAVLPGGSFGDALRCPACKAAATLDGIEPVPADGWCPLPSDTRIVCDCECHADGEPCGSAS